MPRSNDTPPRHPVAVDENVTVICDRHRRKVAANPEGTSPVVHVAGNQAEACDSARFLVRREEVVNREDVIPVLAARAQAMAVQRRALRELGNGIGGAATTAP